MSAPEGVETVDELSLLQFQGCDEAQGFLFGAAAPPAVAESWLPPDGVVRAFGNQGPLAA